MLIEEALQIIEQWTPEELRNLNRDDINNIIAGMNGEEMAQFFIEKNIKVFGSVTAYIDNFLQNPDIRSMDTSANLNALNMLRRIYQHPSATLEDRAVIQEAINGLIHKIMIRAAPAAGGRRKKNKTKKRAVKNRKR